MLWPFAALVAFRPFKFHDCIVRLTVSVLPSQFHSGSVLWRKYCRIGLLGGLDSRPAPSSKIPFTSPTVCSRLQCASSGILSVSAHTLEWFWSTHRDTTAGQVVAEDCDLSLQSGHTSWFHGLSLVACNTIPQFTTVWLCITSVHTTNWLWRNWYSCGYSCTWTGYVQPDVVHTLCHIGCALSIYCYLPNASNHTLI